MISLQTKAHVGSDGMLTVQVPESLRETDIDVTLFLEPHPEELGWPSGFFEATFGSLKDDPIERGPQGEYEVREAIK